MKVRFNKTEFKRFSSSVTAFFWHEKSTHNLLKGLLFGILSLQDWAHADFYYDNFCVTSPESKVLLRFDDYIWTRAERYPQTYPLANDNKVVVADTYDFEGAKMPELSLGYFPPWLNANWPRRTRFVNSTDGSTSKEFVGRESGKQVQIIKAPNLVNGLNGKIQITFQNTILFQLPLIRPDRDTNFTLTLENYKPKEDPKKIIFNGVSVNSVVYSYCGEDAN